MSLSKSALRIAMCGMLLFILLPVWAAYLTNMPVSLRQPDGTKMECFASGDEYHNWLHDANNFTIIQSPSTGYYVYALSSGGTLRAGSDIVGRANPRALGIKAGINISEQEYKQKRASKFNNPAPKDAPTSGTINNLVVFIRFSGEAEFGDEVSLYDGMLNNATAGYNSMRNYFTEASYNALTVDSGFYPVPSGGMVVSYQDAQLRSYYQPYNAVTNTNGYVDDAARATREHSLLRDACNYVSGAVPAGLSIDGDGDGFVDNVCFVVSGSAGAWASLLWPHRWVLYSYDVSINGKQVYDYNFQLQTFLTARGVGVLCHEFFHSLGSPDLYHYTSDGVSPAGSWDLMDGDNDPPQHMSAFMKWKYGHWISSIPTITANQVYSLNPLTSPTGNAYRIDSPNSASEYFVVEFRKQTGTFEGGLPGSGLLVWRVNTLAGNGNASGPPDELYVYRPGGSASTNGSIDSAFFSSESGRTEINDATNPSAFLSSGNPGGLSLYGIGSSAGSTINFYKGAVNITWNPASFTEQMGTNQTASQTLTIGNTGNQTLNYSCALPSDASIILDETFAAASIPSGWTQVNDTGATNWTFVAGGYNGYPSAAYDGSYNARLYYASYAAVVTKLVTPSLNLSSASSASLSFWHTQANWSGDQDELRVYYKTSAAGSWNLLSTYTSNVTIWTQETIALPALTGTYYIGFQGTAKYGYGVCLDKVIVTKSGGVALNWFNINSGTTVSGTIAGVGASHNITVGFNSSGLTDGLYSSNITIISNSTTNSTVTIPVTLTVGTLPPANTPIPDDLSTDVLVSTNLAWTLGGGTPTGYKLYLGTNNPPTNMINGNNIGNVLTYDPLTNLSYNQTYYWKVVPTNSFGDAVGCQVWRFTTGTDPSISIFPHYEGFDGETINSSWTQEYLNGATAWSTSFGGTYGNPAAHSGLRNALLYYGASSPGNTTILVSPAMNLAGKTATLKFWYTQENWGADQDELTVVYKTSSAGSWTELAHFAANIAVWTEVSLELPNESDGYYIGFQGNAKYGFGICLDDVRIVLPASDVAIGTVVVDNVSIDISPITTPGGIIDTAVGITGLAGATTITTVVEYQPAEVTLPNAGLAFTFSGAASFGGTTITITHNLGFIPAQIAYRVVPATAYTLYNDPNNGTWTATTAVFTVPGVKADGDLEVVLPAAEGQTLPVEMSSFTAILTEELLVQLDWIVQSETENLGYNVLRSYAADLNQSIVVNSALISTGTANGTEVTYKFVDAEVEMNTKYYYWLENVSLNGDVEYYGPVMATVGQAGDVPPVPTIPLVTALLDAYPNPFNPVTTIHYLVKDGGDVKMDVYNVRGQVVKHFAATHAKAGHYRFVWDGKDTDGRSAASGVYFYRMTNGKFSSSKKMILMK